MLGYLQKFNDLPAALRQKVSDREAMDKIEALEKKYNVPLAALIMKVMVKELTPNDLPDYLLKQNLLKQPAMELAEELKQKIFFPLKDYFSSGAAKPAAPTSLVNQPKVKGANFFFSSDDEEEIRKLTQKIIVAENHGLSPEAIGDKLKEITDRAQINFGSADLADRFSQIIRTYLRGIRNKLDAKATLMKPFQSGGLSFDEDSAEAVMKLADRVFHPSEPGEPIKPLPKIKLAEPDKANPPVKKEISRDAAYDFSKLAKASGKIKADLKKLDTGHELAPLAPAVISSPSKRETEPEIKVKKPAPVKEFKAEAGPSRPAADSGSGAMPLIKRRFMAENLNQNQKTRVEDVKYVPRVMGPLDEIKYMDLINFRRLDRDPLKSVEKIKNKLSLLEEEEYGKKFEAIKFWRQSPINRLYLEIGRLSIGGNKPVDVIIEERKMNNQEYLTAEEFKAIMDFNKSLRF